VVFVLSKIGGLLATPSNLLVTLALLGLFLTFVRRSALRRIGRWLAGASAVLLAVCGWSPLGSLLLYPLEERFPAYAEDDRPLGGAIVLGGALFPNLSFDRKQIAVGDAAERVIALADLSRRRPELRIIFTGGNGSLLEADVAEAAALARFGGTLGFEPARITLERTSRTTSENARETKLILPPDGDARWLLVTSAWHMPRAMGTFRAAGIEVVAYPVDYRTSPDRIFRAEPSITSGLDRVDTAVREWIGLAVYRATGRSTALFPGPAG
jgi:uncharacterized SAM-binding protein YcdF (DUF218 family)